MTTIADLHGIHPFSGMDVASLLDIQEARRGDHPFIIWEPFDRTEEVWTYRRFAEETRQIAVGLARRGVQKGDRVLIHLDNCPESVLTWHACARLGAVGVTTNTRSAQDELNYFASHSRSVAAVTQPLFAESVAKSLPDAKFIAVTETDCGAPAAPGHAPSANERFSGLLEDSSSFQARPADPELPVGIQYTSGTTSRPKAVVWTHANALWGGKVCSRIQTLTPDDVHLVYLPLFHTNAQAYSMLATLWVGGTAVVQPKFSASRFWPISLKHKCTWTSTIPFVVKAILDQEVPDHSYRHFGTAIADAPWDEHFRVQTIGWWGMTETISPGIYSDPRIPTPQMAIGRPGQEYQIAIIDENGHPLREPGEGSLRIKGVRGLSLFLEYADNPKAMADSFDENGFYDTGDRIKLLEDGFLQFGDRDKDMLKVGAENVAASEVERVISTVPAVDEVAVVAKSDPMLDQVPVAFVVPFGGAEAAPPNFVEQIEAACTELLADFKRPREIRIVDNLPRSTLEKVAKNQLRAMLENEG